jgi:hypothetical protein
MTEIRPQPAQERWLSSPADVAVYGGAAFGGKSFALLMEAARHVGIPGFRAVIFRRTYPQITNAGGLWDTAGEIFPHAGGAPKSGDLDWVWRGGARVSFRHLQHEENKYDWQGSQIALVGFDELTHFSESQFFYLLSRNRSTCGVRPYVRATTNPDASSWVKRFLAPWVDRRHPDPAASGEVRWFVRAEGEIRWARSAAELRAAHPGLDPKSCTFVRASIWDNRIGMAKDPGYLGNLQAQTPVERARLLDGDWDVVNEGLVYPDFGRCVDEREAWPKQITGTDIGGIDWGWNNPFAAVLGTLDRDDVLWLHWERYGSRITLGDHARALPRREVRWWADPAGADQIAELRRHGHDVVASTHTGQQPLQHGIDLVTQRIRSGRLRVRGDLGHLIDEAGKYRYDKQTERPLDQDNHALAALRYLITAIDRGKAAPRDATDRAGEINESALELAAEKAAAEAEHRDPFNDHWFE